MKRYILTGTPGSGKTAILRLLEHLGHSVVEEAASAVIARMLAQCQAEPWAHPSFIDAIVALQRQRQQRAASSETEVQFYDRSPICTHALAVHLGRPITARLSAELDRITGESTYERQVFFIRNQGFCEPTAARRISFEDSLVFERIHEQSYRAFGYELVDIPAGDLADRAAAITAITAITGSESPLAGHVPEPAESRRAGAGGSRP